jgi:hypothetical protein
MFGLVDNSSIASFIQSQENSLSLSAKAGLKFYAYSDRGVPAIGFGSDLKDKNTGAVNPKFKGIIIQYLATHPLLTFTFDDFVNMSPNAYIDKATAMALFKSGFDDAYNYVTTTYTGLTLNQTAAVSRYRPVVINP